MSGATAAPAGMKAYTWRSWMMEDFIPAATDFVDRGLPAWGVVASATSPGDAVEDPGGVTRVMAGVPGRGVGRPASTAPFPWGVQRRRRFRGRSGGVFAPWKGV